MNPSFISLRLGALQPRKSSNTLTASLLLGFLNIGFQSSAWSQTALPDPTPELRRQQEREAETRKRLETQPDVRLPEQAKAELTRLLEAEKPCYKIDAIHIDGEDAKDFAWIQGAFTGIEKDDAPLGRCIGAQGINLLLKRGQDALIAKGYVTSRLVAQEQDLKTGQLHLTLIVGRIRDIRFKTEGAVGSDKPDTNKAIVAVSNPTSYRNAFPGKPGDILNLRDIEQGLENFKRVPTVEADIKIEPAQALGQSDIVIEWKQSKRFRYSGSLDDTGSDTTGKYQGSATISYDNPLGLNDLFYVTLSGGVGGKEGPTPKGTQGVVAHYSVPYGYWNIGTTLSTSKYKQTVIGAYENYLYSGSSLNWEAKASNVLFRNAAHKTNFSAKLLRKGSNNYIDDTEVEVQRRITSAVELSLAHRYYWGSATVDGQIAYKQGLKILGALAAPEEAFDEGTSQYKIINLDASISTPFKLGEQNFKLDSAFKLQHNLTPLIAQDRFAIGGRYTVRGFDSKASLAAEKGFYLQNTVSWRIPKLDQEAYLGVDIGKVSGLAVEGLVGDTLAGAVLGLRGKLKGVGYDIFVGRPLRKPSELQAGSVFGFSLNYSF